MLEEITLVVSKPCCKQKCGFPLPVYTGVWLVGGTVAGGAAMFPPPQKKKKISILSWKKTSVRQ